MANKIEKSNVQDIFNLSGVQNGMLYYYLKEDQGSLYNVQLSFRLKGDLDVEVMEKAFHAVQSNHEVLRSVFRWKEVNKPIQIFLKKNQVKVLFHDLSGLDEKEAIQESDVLTKQDRSSRFDLETLPIKLRIIKIKGHDFLLNITNHHILYDGWSKAILLKELFYSYNSLKQNEEPTFVDKPSYKEIHSRKNNDADSESKEYFWKSYLKNYEPPVSRGSVKEIRNSRVARSSFKTSISNVTLENFAKRHKVTKAAIIYMAYGLFMQKYYSLTDVIFGSTVSNRNPLISGSNDVIGNFINTIPTRVEGQGLSVLDFITKLNAELIERSAYNESSLYEINKIINQPANEPLFDSTVAIENYPVDEGLVNSVDNLGITLEKVYENPNIPLVLLAFFKDDLELVCNYKADLYEEAFVVNLFNYLQHILDQILQNPTMSTADIKLLTEEKEREIIEDFNSNGNSKLNKSTVIDLFDRQVTDTPKNIAVVYNGKQISYEELNIKSDHLSALLHKGGVKRNDIVGIMVDPSIEMIVGILGILKSGAAYLPLNPDQPEARKQAILEDAGCKKLLCQSKYKNQQQLVDEILVDKLTFDTNEPRPHVAIDPEDLAYLIYTSGTTGKPKGVMIQHANLVNYVDWFKDFAKLSDSDSTVLASSFVFDLGYTAVFPSILFGCQLHLIDEIVYKSPEVFLSYLEDNKITYLKTTPSLYSTLVDHSDFNKIDTLKRLILGGEKLKADDVRNTFLTSNSIKIINHYGPTETTIGAVANYIDKSNIDVSVIGQAIDNMKSYILDLDGNPVPVGAIGELYISGAGVAKGYLGQPELTSEKFVKNPFCNEETMYQTGDLAKWSSDGKITFLGRKDGQVKVRGYRVELDEISAHLSSLNLVKEATVTLDQNDQQLVGYYVAEKSLEPDAIIEHLSLTLPDYMVPRQYVHLEALPLTPNGKLDKGALPQPEPQTEAEEFVSAASKLESDLLEIWSTVLGHDKLNVKSNFFEVGGDSIKLILVTTRIIKKLKVEIQITDLFDNPTIKDLAEFLSTKNKKSTSSNGEAKEKQNPPKQKDETNSAYAESDIAIIGMAGRFPGAKNIEEFLNNLREGKDAISREVNADTEDSIVKAKGVIDGIEFFEASFFNYIPDEAKLMDPQMRIFHECTWAALEDAGYNPFDYKGNIGLYAGASYNPFPNKTDKSDNSDNWFDAWKAYSYSTKDFMSTRVSYKLNLKGPSVNVSTACSTSLVAIDMAAKDLLNNSADIAIAGGISLTYHDNDGYEYIEDMILSPDGYCRAFDKNAAGTVGGNGVGIVVLKKLNQAIKDGDNIHAIIKGSATNNDGLQKVGFTAPSIEGQSNVIKKALENANVPAESISYVEAHGTGTLLGDPIEFRGLNMAFNTDKKQFCAIGSVKTNIGHLNAASGVTGLIKTVLSLKNREIFQSLNYEEPNEAIDLEESPFYIAKDRQDWKTEGIPLRAGVSSFGIGGTNAHVVLEEAPQIIDSPESRPSQVITFSAKTKKSLVRNIENFNEHLSSITSEDIADIAYTQNIGRASFNYRTTIVCDSVESALSQINDIDIDTFSKSTEGQLVAFMFSGQGSQYTKMLYDLYQTEIEFAKEADNCFEIVKKNFQKDLKTLLYEESEKSEEKINETEYTQPLLFIMEYALARLLISWGVTPDVVIGHSIGEYVAACISGVFTLEDALKLVVKRGELMQRAEKGSMLSITISEEQLATLITGRKDLSIAAINSSESCVISGNDQSIVEFKESLDNSGINNKLVKCSHAFHSYMMDEILQEFRQVVESVKKEAPKLPVVSNLTGKPASDKNIKDSDYWVNHLRGTVKFSQGIDSILKNEKVVFIEVGPGQTLSSFVRSNKNRNKQHKVVQTVRHPKVETNDLDYLLGAVGDLYKAGIHFDWNVFYKNEKRKRTSLPTYSFEKISYPIPDPGSLTNNDNKLVREKDVSQWFYLPSWKSAPLIGKNEMTSNECYLLFGEENDVIKGFGDQCTEGGNQLVRVERSDVFEEISPTHYRLNPGNEEDFVRLFDRLRAHNLFAGHLIHAWGIDSETTESLSFTEQTDRYLLSLLYLLKAAQSAESIPSKKRLIVLTNDTQSILGTEEIAPGKSLPAGLLKVIPQEYPLISASHIDISAIGDFQGYTALHHEIDAVQEGKTIALRKAKRWELTYEKVQFDRIKPNSLRTSGIYLITGGLGDLGYNFGLLLAKKYRAKLILIGRTELPAEAHWNEYEKSADANAGIVDKISRINTLRKYSEEVIYINADISDHDIITKEVQLAEETVGKLNGIIHAAGILGTSSKKAIAELDKSDFETHFNAKVKGLNSIKEITENRELDFCILTSSLSTILGGLQFGAYVPANIYMDHFVQSHRERNELKNWTSINFDGLNLKDGVGEGINSHEFEEVFSKIFSLIDQPQFAISVGDLNIRLDKWVHRIDTQPLSNELETEQIIEIDDQSSSNSTENKLIVLWKKFFGNDEIEKQDDFFELGGDSLKALTMIGQVYKHFNVEISVTEFFKHSVLKSLGKLIDDQKVESIPNETFSIPQAKKEDYYTLNSVQKRLFFLNQFDPSSIAYNMPLAIKLNGKIDRQKLGDSFMKLIERHESLRTSFKVINEEPASEVLEKFDFEIEYYQANGNESEIIESFIRPFALDAAPLIRVGLIHVSENVEILLVDLHHIISDGVSKSVLIDDFMSFYSGKELIDLRLQYKDFSIWQQGAKQQEAIKSQKEFWLNEFTEEYSALSLPTDFPRPNVKTFAGELVNFDLSNDETNKLKSIAEKQGTTTFTVLLAIYNILLSRLTNHDDIILGSPVSGRPHADFEQVIGMFINTIPIRSNVDAELPFDDYLNALKSKVLQCFDNQFYPYEELVEELNIGRDASRNPIFDTLFAFQNYVRHDLQIPGVTLEPYEEKHNISKLDLSLLGEESNGRLSFRFEYSTELFKRETITRFVEYFKKIVAAVIDDRHIKISSIDILSESERSQLVQTFNNTQVDIPQGETVISLFENQVAKNPDNIALLADGRSISYQELEDSSNRIANYLLQREIGEGDIVAILLDKSVDMIAVVIGVLKTGAAYLPLDISQPKSRISKLIDESDVKLLLTNEVHMHSYSDLVSTIHYNDNNVISASIAPFEFSTSPEGTAYIIYTSGSTGNPKGVIVRHNSIVNMVMSQSRLFGINDSDSVLMFSNLSFDASVEQIWLALINGAALVVPTKEVLLNNHMLNDWIERLRITTLYGTPSFLKNIEIAKSNNTLKRLITGGEISKPELVNRFIDKYDFYIDYGPTEATVTSIAGRVTKKDIERNLIPIGKPIDNSAIYILGDQLNLLPIGVRGELCIGGSGLAKGYLNDEVRTNEKFVADPFSPGNLMYKTGDVARWLPDGSIEFLGRKDDQVKLRGFRVELGEIESNLLSHDKIKETVVLVRQRGADKFLVAYYVGSEELESESLREYLMERLPDYMVPAYYVAVESFTLTANDKLNKAALPLPDVSQKDYLAPQTPQEELLAEVWSIVLGLDQVGITDNFFSVGGDSIKSIQISSRVRSAGYELSVQDIFAYQTIKSLSPHLKMLSKESQQSTVEGSSSLTPVQQSFFEGPIANKNHFNQSVMINFSEGISRTEVETIFKKLHDHHDALRMIYPSEGGVISQLNRGTDISLSITEVDLTKASDIASSLLLNSQKLQTGIVIDEGPLVHLGLFHTPSGSRLLIVIHHLVVDGVSWRILFEDIESLYQQLKHAEPMVLPKKTDPFLFWSSKLKEYCQGNDFEQGRDYWNHFHEKALERIPRDYPEGSNKGTDRQMLSFTLSPESTDRLLQDVHSSFGTQVNDILLSALYLSIEKEYGFNHLQIDLESHGRASLSDINISRTIGWFTTLYPVLLSRQGEGLGDLVKGVKEGLRKVPNSGLDYLLLKHSTEELTWKEQESNSQLLFNYLGQFDTDTSGRSYGLSDDSRGAEVSQDEERSYDWDVSGVITSGKLTMSLGYSNAQYNSDRMKSLVRHFEESLVEIIDYCTSYGKTEFTPSDMTYPGLSIPQLDQLQQKYDLVDIYPLSPMQDGMLFHSMFESDLGSYVGQTTCQVKGQLDINIVEEGMNELMSRYDVLRTLFLPDGYDRSLQVVLKERKIDFIFKDIRSGEIQEEIKFYQDQEKSRTFDLSKDVLMRLVVLQTSEDQYEFIWSHHHVLMDGWCIGIIVNEFVEFYGQRLKGQPLSLPVVKPYSDYINWLENLASDSSRDYWKHYLAAYSEFSGFPQKDTLSAEGLPYQLKTRELVLDEKKAGILNEFSRSQGLTINTLFQTVWGILLGKYNNSTDVVFGSVVSGRPSEIEGIESMVGLFINTVPVRINFTGEESITDLLKTVQRQSVEGNRHHYYPLSEIQSLTSLGNGLLDHIIAFENYPLSEQVEGSGNAEADEQPFVIRNAEYNVQTNYDLSITVMPSKKLTIKFKYDGNKFEEATISNLISQLQQLFFTVTEQPNLPVSSLSLLSDEERIGEKLRLSSDLEMDAKMPSVQEYLKSSFDNYGANTAIEYRGHSYTYSQLDNDVSKIAHQIAASNLDEGSAVGILCSDRYWITCAVIGILKSRMMFVPLETTLPKRRLDSMVDQTGASLIITDQSEEVYHDLKNSSANWLTIDNIKQSEKHLAWKEEYQPEDQIYVYFTSGSTGTPKGVVGKNKGLSHFIRWEIDTFNIDQEFRVSQFTNPGFDAFLRDVFVPLCAGGTICIPEESILSMDQEISRWITEQRITLMHCVPSLFKLIQKNNLDSTLFTDLKYILLAGEKVLPYELRDWYNIFGDRIQLANLYGATETTLIKGIRKITSNDVNRSFLAVKAIEGAQFLVLDRHLNIVPKGATGEIYIRTPYRTAGYLNLEKANQEAFITNPFNDNENDVIYKTGDLGKVHEDEIEILGRIDQQVKIRGVRIELDDIKKNILDFDGVTDAVVLIRPDTDNELYICAYIVCPELDTMELRQYLNDVLPQNMIPSYLIPLTSLPLTANGKVNVNALPEPEINKDVDYERPANEIESQLVEIFSEVLRIEKDLISTKLSFFEMGGHSLKLMQFRSKINQAFDVKVSIDQIFKKQNIQNLADYLIAIKQIRLEVEDTNDVIEISI